jgi:hypothetical protein
MWIVLVAFSLVAQASGGVHCDSHGDADCSVECVCICCADATLSSASCEAIGTDACSSMPTPDALSLGRLLIADILRPPAAV